MSPLVASRHAGQDPTALPAAPFAPCVEAHGADGSSAALSSSAASSPGSRVDIQRESGVHVWLCAVAPSGAMVFDGTETVGVLEVRDAGSGLLEVRVSTTGGKGASADLVFSYEPDRDRLLGG